MVPVRWRLVSLVPVLALAGLAGCLGGDAPPLSEPTPPAALALRCVADPCAVATEHRGAEPWLAVNPNDSLHAVGAAMTTPLRSPVTHPWMSAYVTFDGGATWTAAPLPGGPSDPQGPLGTRTFAADPMTAITLDGRVLVAGLVADNVGFACSPLGFPCVAPPAYARRVAIALWTSEDGGRSYDGGRILVEGEGVTVAAFAGPVGERRTVGAWQDREAMVLDHASGTVHIVWSRLAEPRSELWTVRSEDHGRTWGSPVLVAASHAYGPHVAAHNGTVLVTFKDGFEGTYEVVRSADGGATWSEPVVLGELPTQQWQAAAVALWQNDTVLEAVVARPAGEDQSRMLLDVSVDGGATWRTVGEAMRPAPSAIRDPGLALDPWTGRGILATFVGGVDDGNLGLQVMPFAHGRPAAIEPLVPANGTTPRWIAFEYFGVAAAGDRAYVLWPMATGPSSLDTFAAALAWS